MSWLFSQALAAEYSEGTSLAGEQFAQLNVMPTPHKFWRNDKTMEFSNLSRFGLTLRLLTESHGEELLMSYLAGFRARTLAQLQEVERLESMDGEVGFGRKWSGSFARYDLVSSTWKTHQYSLLGGLDEYLETWPRAGLMHAGVCWVLPMLALTTRESAYGYWPTPAASDTSNRQVSTSLHTTKTGSLKHIGKDGVMSQIRLSQAVKFRTPNASDANKWSNQTESERKAKGQQVRLGHQLEAGGLLNPMWVEWLMGWPLGWTDLKPLAMDRFLEWQQQHSLCLLSEQDSGRG